MTARHIAVAIALALPFYLALAPAPTTAQYLVNDQQANQKLDDLKASAAKLLGAQENNNSMTAAILRSVGDAASARQIDVSKWTTQLAQLRQLVSSPAAAAPTPDQAVAAVKSQFYSPLANVPVEQRATLNEARKTAANRAAINAYAVSQFAQGMIAGMDRDVADLAAEASASTQLLPDSDAAAKIALITQIRVDTLIILTNTQLQLTAANAIVADPSYTAQ